MWTLHNVVGWVVIIGILWLIFGNTGSDEESDGTPKSELKSHFHTFIFICGFTFIMILMYLWGTGTFL